MGRRPGKAPLTQAEAKLLTILVESGAKTVRDLYDLLALSEPVAYTTVLKTLQNMHDKGLVRRDESSRTHIYSANAQVAESKKSVARELMNRIFGGSPSDMLLHAVDRDQISQEDLDALQRAIDDLKRQQEGLK